MKSLNYSEVEVTLDSTVKTGNKELDAFFSADGGLVEKSAIFLTGTPGAGKTTFAFVLQNIIKNYKTCLYSREMTAAAVKNQLKRYGTAHENAYIVDRKRCDNLSGFIEEELNVLKPKVVIIDSLQVIMREDYANESPEKSGYNIIKTLRDWVEENSAILIVVGHVTKEGEFEGRNTIKHMFDAHLEMIYDEKKNTRTISWAKNRFGAASLLYYVFGRESLEFYSTSQYEVYNNKKSFNDFITGMIVSFLNSVDRKNPNYNKLKKEAINELEILTKSNKSVFEVNVEMIIVIKKLLEKYGFQV